MRLPSRKQRKPKKTSHQREIMGVILRETGKGNEVTQESLMTLLSYAGDVTYGAIRKSVTWLVEGGFLERSYKATAASGVRKCHLTPTLRGYDWFRPLRDPLPPRT